MLKLMLRPYFENDDLSFDDFIGEKINANLYKSISTINNSSKWNEDFINFSNKYNVKYLGEVLERYEERAIVKTPEDLRALLVFTVESFLFENPDVNTNQLDVFIEKVEKDAILNKDVFNMGLLLLSKYILRVSIDNECLLEKIITELKNNESLSYEEKVWGIYSCYNYTRESIELKQDEDEDDSSPKEDLSYYEGAKKEILEIITQLGVEPLKSVSSFYIYLMLASIIIDDNYLTTQKNFKNKEFCNQYKKLISLLKKEYKGNDIEKVAKVLKMENCELLAYNYLLSEYCGSCAYTYVYTNVTSKGRLRLIKSTFEFFSKDKLVPSVLIREIEEIINEIANEKDVEKSSSFCTYKKGKTKAIDILFEKFNYKVSILNFDSFVKLTCLKEDVQKFILSSNLSFLLEDEYKDCLDKILKSNYLMVFLSTIRNSENRVLIKKAYEYLKMNDFLDGMLETDYSILYKLNIINDSYYDMFFLSFKRESYLRHIMYNSTKEDLLKELRMIFNDLKDGSAKEKIENKNPKKEEYPNKYEEYIVKEICKDLSDVFFRLDISEIFNENNEIGSDYQKLKDEFMFRKLKRIEYMEYMFNSLISEGYKMIVGLKNEDVTQILKNLYDTIKVCYPSYKDNYRAHGLIVKIEDIVLTKKEKEDLKQQAIKEEQRDSLKLLKEANSIYIFKKVLKKYKDDIDFIDEFKEIFMERIVDKKIMTSLDIDDGYKVVRNLVDLNKFSDEELLHFSKICLSLV